MSTRPAPPPGSVPPADASSDLHAALDRAEARYAALVGRVGLGAYCASRNGTFVDVNPMLVLMLGYATAEEVLQLDPARDVYAEPGEIDRVITRCESRTFLDWTEAKWKRRDGTAITVRLSLRPILDDAGDVDGYDGIVDDITERFRQDELLRRSERMASLGTTLAGVAHELNNPLAAIIGFAQLLLKRSWPADDHAALETIHHEAIRSANIVKDLLALARKPDAERRVATNLNDIVDYIVRTRRYALETAGIVCSLELDPALPAVYGDRAQLEQVVLNLLNNAEQALLSGLDDTHPSRRGEIRLRTRVDGVDAIIDVEDNGPGIPESVRSQIWDPFWTTKDEGEGIGLGLTVVHGIVVDHGGTISVESAPTSGARFVVRLPIANEAAPPAPTGQASRPLDVLVVDPGASDLLFVERFLTSRGHAVINAGSGDLAIRLSGQTSFDAVVCDARLVGRDGTSIASALRRTAGCTSARFILSSAEPIDAGQPPTVVGDAIVIRPYDVEELRRLIEGD